MNYKVTIDKEKRLVTINGTRYTLQQLGAKVKSEIENNIYRLADVTFKCVSENKLFDQSTTYEFFTDERLNFSIKNGFSV